MKKFAIGWFFFVCCVLSAQLRADEPAQAFLDALRDDGYYDLAIEYLTGLENSDLISDDFRQILPFEKADTLISSTSAMRDINKIESRLDEAQQLLSEYAKRNQSPETVARTYRYQGNLLLGRSKVYAKRAESDRLTAGEREEINAKVREMLQASRDSYQQARSKIRALIDPNSPDVIRIDVEDPSTTEKLKQLQAIYTLVRIRLPMVIEQLADTYPATSPDRVQLYEEAVKEYTDVYDDYRRYPAGLEACLFAARCNQKLGKHQECLRGLEDIFSLGESSTFKMLKRRAFVLAADSWNQSDPYPFNEVIARLEPSVSVLNRTEIRNPEWLRIQMELAKALHIKADEVKKQGGPKASSDSKALDRNAARIMRSVSRVPSEYRDQARQLLSEWDISISDVSDAEEKPPETFVDAQQKARDFIVEIESLLTEVNQLNRELSDASSDQQKSDIEEKLAETRQDIKAQAQATLDVLELSLQLVDDATLRADINNVRYMESYCYFATEQYYESAVIGEFLLAKYPTVDGTRQAMTLMIQSYSKILDAAADKDKPFVRNQLVESAQAVVQRWPGSNEAGLAASTLTKLAMSEKDFPAAEQYFAEIPESTFGYGILASRLGQGLWFDYKAKARTADVDPATLSEQLKNSIRYLLAGVSAGNLESVTYEQALAALLLVDAYLEAGNSDQAVERLEIAEIAPLDLVKQKHPAIVGTPMANLFVRETYKIAIKTYLAAMKTGDQQKWIDKISGVIAAMRLAMEASNDPSDRAQITNIYRLIASELKNQFESMESAEDKKKFATSLATFLGSIEKDSNDSKTVLWSGATLLSIAESLQQIGLADASKPLFRQAVSALNRAESLGFAGDPQEQAMNRELKRQRALAQRGSGSFEDAVNQFIEILRDNPLSLADQIYAAETLQMWAKSANRSQGYAEAMMGVEKVTDPKTKRTSNLVWGWRKLVQATRSNPKFIDTYYQSLYNLTECRFEYGVLENSDKAIESSLKEIENAEKRDAKLGSPQWKQKFDKLKLRIKQNLPD